jgi:carbamate kinase
MLYLLGLFDSPIPRSPLTHRKVLVALGGNALLQSGEKGTWEEALKNAEITSSQLVELLSQGHELVVTHGNGPQVGSIKLQHQLAADKVPEMNLFVCGAMSQGYLGFLLQQTMQNILRKKGMDKPVCSIVTQVLVDRSDPSFQNPTKPIGRFYTEAQAEEMKKEGKQMVEDSGRGWRVVVPSPHPVDIIEGESIHKLIDAGHVVISTGGGGIPVVRKDDGTLEGVEAVIDKDLGAAVLGKITGADVVIIATDVEGVYLDFRGPNKRMLRELTVSDAEKYYTAGEFAKGSMGPKVLAGIKFTKLSGKPTIITSLHSVLDALAGKTGTKIIP